MEYHEDRLLQQIQRDHQQLLNECLRDNKYDYIFNINKSKVKSIIKLK